MFAIVGPMTIAVKSTQSAQYARQQNTAFFLAQEGITAVNVLRNDGGLSYYLGNTTNPWDWLDDPALAPCRQSHGCNINYTDVTLLDNIKSCQIPTGCNIYYEGAGRGRYMGETTGESTPYRRTVTLEVISPDEVIVNSTVSWESGLLGGTQTVSLATSLFNVYK
jgi:hypothetical protein